MAEASSRLHAALEQVDRACRKRRQVDDDIDAAAASYVGDVAEHEAVLARSTKRAKLRRINRPYDSVAQHPMVFGLVNASRNALLHVTPSELRELEEKENTDAERSEIATKAVEQYAVIRAMFTRASRPVDTTSGTKALRDAADGLEWIAEYANKLANDNKL